MVTIQTRVIIVFIILLVLLSAAIVTMSLLVKNNIKLAAGVSGRLEAIGLADQLRQSSDDLTRMVRTYAVTGNEKYEKYFYEILAIRDGLKPRPQNYNEIYWDIVTPAGERPTPFGAPISLLDLMKKAGLSGGELAKLNEAKKNSDDLTNLEKIAFMTVKGLFADDSGEFTIKQSPDPKFSREILHGKEYHAAKTKIMQPISEFMKLLDRRTLQEVKTIQTASIFLRNIAILLILTVVLFSVFSFFHIRRRILEPITSLSAIASSSNKGKMGERSLILSSHEINILGDDFNGMVEKIEDLVRNLKRSNTELEQFACVASHDLKSPLRGIENLISWLSKDLKNTLSEKNQHYMDLLQNRVGRMDSMLNGLLEYSQVGKRIQESETVNIGTLIKEVITFISLPKGMAVHIKSNMPTIQIQRVPLELVFRNLIGNAAKHNDRDQGEVNIEYHDLGEYAQFTIEDDGPGILQKYHERIFGLFQTLQPRDEVEGSGMGLALVKGTIEFHGGTIKIISDPALKRGTVFQFTWPKQTAEQA